MANQPNNPLARLSQLVKGEESASGPMSEQEIAEMEAQEAQADKVIQKVLRFVGDQPDCDDVFVAQELVEACAEELRNRIRDMVEGEDE
jgi:hypothetical protein